MIGLAALSSSCLTSFPSSSSLMLSSSVLNNLLSIAQNMSLGKSDEARHGNLSFRADTSQ